MAGSFAIRQSKTILARSGERLAFIVLSLPGVGEMAITAAMIRPCSDCGKDVSTDAQACPHCGKPVSKPAETTAKVVFGIIGGILLAIALMYFFAR
jgi:DNA-directed RNA polymerase subunit RPC12/RpoP